MILVHVKNYDIKRTNIIQYLQWVAATEILEAIAPISSSEPRT